MTPGRGLKLSDISALTGLITAGQTHAEERMKALKDDLEQKHAENKERRHQLVGKFEALEGRIYLAEKNIGGLDAKLYSIVGDNSGGSGLLHDIDKKVDALKNEVASIKQTVQDTPSINRWIYGAMGVVALLAVVVPIIVSIILWVLKH